MAFVVDAEHVTFLGVPFERIPRMLQEILSERTRVLAKRQKLVGLSVGGRPAADDCPLERIKLKTPHHRFILVGTPEVRFSYGERIRLCSGTPVNFIQCISTVIPDM